MERGRAFWRNRGMRTAGISAAGPPALPPPGGPFRAGPLTRPGPWSPPSAGAPRPPSGRLHAGPRETPRSGRCLPLTGNLEQGAGAGLSHLRAGGGPTHSGWAPEWRPVLPGEPQAVPSGGPKTRVGKGEGILQGRAGSRESFVGLASRGGAPLTRCPLRDAEQKLRGKDEVTEEIQWQGTAATHSRSDGANAEKQLRSLALM